MRHTIHRAVFAAGLCALLPTTSCSRAGARTAPSQPPSALTFTIRVAGTSFDGKAWPAESISTKLRDGVLRLDFASQPDPSGRHRPARDFYLLVNLGAKTSTVVMPARKLYWETRLDTSVARRAKSRPFVDDIEVSGQAVGMSETINGYATKRYRITTRYTETPRDTSAGYARKKVQLEEDVWVAEAFTDVVDPIRAYLHVLRPSGARDESHQTVDEVAEKQAKARRKLFSGLPIRRTVVYTHTFDGRWTASRSSTVDLLDVKRADMDPDAFRVPDGYGRFDLKAALENAAELLLQGGLKRAPKDRKIPE